MSTNIQRIIDALTASVTPLEYTVDKLVYGDPDTTVKGIGVTFLATQAVIEKAKDLDVNLIISHEGIFYSHLDKGELIKDDPIYQKKCKIIEESEMAIFRFHDYIHRYRPDGIMAGLLQSLEWQKYEIINKPTSSVLEIPSMTLEEVILHIKNCLNIQHVRFAGDLSMPCKRIGLLAGYRGGGELAIPLFQNENLDLIIYGEGPEWELPEYVRDALHQGKQKALITLGHAESEAPGMEYLAQWIQEKFPEIPVQYISDKPVLQVH